MMPRNNALEAQLADNPDDTAVWAVYADWLQEQGHPLGALIAAKLAGVRVDDELAEQGKQLLGASLEAAPATSAEVTRARRDRRCRER